jgi:hypothetical protein
VDGRFAANLPDLTQDPAVQSVEGWRAGELRFSIRDAATKQEIGIWKPVGSALTRHDLPLRPGYPEEQVFELESVKQ